ncbi:3-phosphoglycerate dehydrogenase family protein [Solibaculum mannosilyticum]|uniref:D-3-phosphoglycerate dehydrogenase n=1 Tax=Solibaculum mannosilyticum TaxID=2780922 RepID=A0A7I8D4J6_9FIRM|nr:3-phosphoglycerate dehydrogenase family protein [Solibaculum mannosilyticum]MCO7137397.1 3-phosphoglycerate dehydrogenase family protein [[Clostridium] leptum]BCI59554.1 3-phosphoglycerate dehydrogenase [Solibaculum mannosilyticum]CZT55335.1 D-3-phosphoglycerate dehydrogenase [Eubacteriaceae bacterium CHKCI005]
MYRIQTLNKISPKGLANLDENYEVSDTMENPDAILVRSASMHEMEMPASLKAIARAGAGTNNIPVDQCAEAGIVVFNTPGANANAVKELVIAGMLLCSRKVVDGIEWAKSLKGNGDQVGKMVEKGKSSFVGPEIAGKKLGVIGLGAIGVRVANAAAALDMEVFGYDPYLSVDAAWGLSSRITHAKSLEEIYRECDYITIHVPQTPDTKGMINAEAIASMKEGVRILNFARGGLVNEADLIAGLESGKVAAYVTDFPSDALLDVKGVIPLPHLGASTPESEENCACMAALQVKDFLENGNIINSVNFPRVEMARSAGCTRICIIHRNLPNVLSHITESVSSIGLNIENMQSHSKKDYAYAILDVTGDVTADVLKKIDDKDFIVRIWTL